MKVITPTTSNDAARGHGWEKGLAGVALQPLGGLAKEAPDFLGFHGVAPGNKCELVVDLENGDYSVAVLANDLRAPQLLRNRSQQIAVGEQIAFERKLEGREVVEDYYRGMNLILRRERDMWRDYVEPHLQTIRIPARASDGKLRLRFSGNLVLNALLIYLEAEKARLDEVLATVAQERKKENKWRTEVVAKAQPGVPPTEEERARGYRVIALPSLGHFEGFGSAAQGIVSGGPLQADLERKFHFTAARDMWLSFRIGI
jgi:hypothetical protein